MMHRRGFLGLLTGVAAATCTGAAVSAQSGTIESGCGSGYVFSCWVSTDGARTWNKLEVRGRDLEALMGTQVVLDDEGTRLLVLPRGFPGPLVELQARAGFGRDVAAWGAQVEASAWEGPSMTMSWH